MLQLLDRVRLPDGAIGTVQGVNKNGRVRVHCEGRVRYVAPEKVRRAFKKRNHQRRQRRRELLPENYDPKLLALAQANGVSYRFAAEVVNDG